MNWVDRADEEALWKRGIKGTRARDRLSYERKM